MLRTNLFTHKHNRADKAALLIQEKVFFLESFKVESTWKKCKCFGYKCTSFCVEVGTEIYKMYAQNNISWEKCVVCFHIIYSFFPFLHKKHWMIQLEKKSRGTKWNMRKCVERMKHSFQVLLWIRIMLWLSWVNE